MIAVCTREEAIELIGRLYACRPKDYFGKIDDSRKGSGFILICLHGSDHDVLAGELAKELNVSTARIAALLKTMEKNGLVERFHPASDARQTVVRLTAAGNDEAEKLKECIIEKTMHLVDRVGRKDLDEFIRISGKICEACSE